jgi:hypothetical protein
MRGVQYHEYELEIEAAGQAEWKIGLDWLKGLEERKTPG